MQRIQNHKMALIRVYELESHYLHGSINLQPKFSLKWVQVASAIEQK